MLNGIAASSFTISSFSLQGQNWSETLQRRPLARCSSYDEDTHFLFLLSSELFLIQNPKSKIPHHGERIGLIKTDSGTIEMRGLAFAGIPCNFKL